MLTAASAAQSRARCKNRLGNRRVKLSRKEDAPRLTFGKDSLRAGACMGPGIKLLGLISSSFNPGNLLQLREAVMWHVAVLATLCLAARVAVRI